MKWCPKFILPGRKRWRWSHIVIYALLVNQSISWRREWRGKEVYLEVRDPLGTQNYNYKEFLMLSNDLQSAVWCYSCHSSDCTHFLLLFLAKNSRNFHIILASLDEAVHALEHNLLFHTRHGKTHVQRFEFGKFPQKYGINSLKEREREVYCSDIKCYKVYSDSTP